MSLLRVRAGFSFLEMMLYLSVVSLSYHYAIPCYHQLIGKLKSQELIKAAQQAQLQLNEYVILAGDLPQSLELEQKTNSAIKDIAWNQDTLVVRYEPEGINPMTLTLTPQIEHFALVWECELEGNPQLQPYVCYALT